MSVEAVRGQYREIAILRRPQRRFWLAESRARVLFHDAIREHGGGRFFRCPGTAACRPASPAV